MALEALAGIVLAVLVLWWWAPRRWESPRKPPFCEEPLILKGGTWCSFDIVGESHYQSALASLAGGAPVNTHWTAILRPEPSNPHDPNAVQVTIDGLTVGYLAREEAEEYVAYQRDLGLDGRCASCTAYISGGFLTEGGHAASYGVKLGLAWPPEIGPA